MERAKRSYTPKQANLRALWRTFQQLDRTLTAREFAERLGGSWRRFQLAAYHGDENPIDHSRLERMCQSTHLPPEFFVVEPVRRPILVERRASEASDPCPRLRLDQRHREVLCRELPPDQRVLVIPIEEEAPPLDTDILSWVQKVREWSGARSSSLGRECWTFCTSPLVGRGHT